MFYWTICCNSSVFPHIVCMVWNQYFYSLFYLPLLFKTWAVTKTECPLFLNVIICSQFPSRLTTFTDPNHFLFDCITQNDTANQHKRACDGNTVQGLHENDCCTSRWGHDSRGMMSRRCKPWAAASASTSIPENAETLSTPSKSQVDTGPAFLSQNNFQNPFIFSGIGRVFVSTQSFLFPKLKEREWRKKTGKHFSVTTISVCKRGARSPRKHDVITALTPTVASFRQCVRKLMEENKSLNLLNSELVNNSNQAPHGPSTARHEIFATSVLTHFLWFAVQVYYEVPCWVKQ